MKEATYFKRYLFQYILVASLIIAGCIPFAYLAYQHIRENKVAENLARLEAGIVSLEGNIQKMRLMGSLLADDPMLLELELINGPIKSDKQLHLKHLMDQMFDISLMYDYADYSFIIFRDNDAFISRSQVSTDFEKFYGSFFAAANFTADEFRDLVFDRKNASQFIMLDQVNYYLMDKEHTSKNALLFLEPLQVNLLYSRSRALLGFIIESDQIKNTLLTEDVKEKGIIQITDRKGNLLVSSGKDAELLFEKQNNNVIRTADEVYRIIEYTDVDSGLKVVLGYPLSLIDEQLRDIIQLLFIYGLIGICFAFIVVVFISRRWYKPISRLINTAESIEGGNLKHKNEFDTIRKSILNLVSTKDELETKMLISNAQKQAIFLENTFLKGFYKKEDEKIFLQQFPLASKAYRVIYLQIYSVNGEMDETNHALLDAMEFVESKYQDSFLHFHSAKDTEIILMPYDETVEEKEIQLFFYQMIKSVTEQHDCLCAIGISSIQFEISNINVAYYQARQTVHAYRYKNMNFVKFYRYINEEDSDIFTMNYLNKFHDLLLGGNRKEIHQMINELRSELLSHKERYEMHKAEIFHMMTFVEYSASKLMTSDIKEEIKKVQFQQNHSLIQCLEIIEKNADGICTWIEQNRNEKKLELLERILIYLQRNFKRYELTTELAASELGISDRYLSTFLKEQTGKTFIVHVDEIRINFAKECLINTDWVNDQIAIECGFGATNSFYRVFKKYVGMTPNNYKQNFKK